MQRIGVWLHHYASRLVLPLLDLTSFIFFRFTRKTFAKKTNVKSRYFNGFEPARARKSKCLSRTDDTPKNSGERHHCASGWSDMYNHSTNHGKELNFVVFLLDKKQLSNYFTLYFPSSSPNLIERLGIWR